MNKSNTLFFLFTCLIIFMFISNSNAGADTTIYAAGVYTEDDIDKACYWINGTLISLHPDGASQSGVNSITVVGEDIYAAGYYTDEDVNKACYWVNGTLTDLHPNEASLSYVFSITVEGADVYAAGYYDNKACYWKNSIRIDLPVTDGTSGAYAYSITVAEADVYMAGYYWEGENLYACYWKNGIRIELGNVSTAIYIAAVKKDVYVAGWSATSTSSPSTACYWKNGTKTNLPGGTPSASFSITVVERDIYVSESYLKRRPTRNHQVAGRDIYVSGFYTDKNISKACYWKNGKKTDLPAGISESVPGAITVAGKDIYMAGAYKEEGVFRACYWKNGVKIDIHPDGASNSYADDIKVITN